jgi:transposase
MTCTSTSERGLCEQHVKLTPEYAIVDGMCFPNSDSRRKLTPAVVDKIWKILDDYPDITVRELLEKLKLSITHAYLRECLKEQGITLKDDRFKVSQDNMTDIMASRACGESIQAISNRLQLPASTVYKLINSCNHEEYAYKWELEMLPFSADQKLVPTRWRALTV